MLKSELLEKIKNAKDNEDINSLLVGTDIEEEFKGESPTIETFKAKIKSDRDFQKFMDVERETHLTKALKTMKEKGTWENEFSDALKEKYPDLIKDPLQIELAKERKAREELEAKLARKDLLTEAMKYAKDKKLPSSIVEKCLGEDFDKTKEFIDAVSKDWSDGLEAIATEKMKQSSYIPGGKGSGGNPVSIGASIASQLNKSSTVPSDPWENK